MKFLEDVYCSIEYMFSEVQKPYGPFEIFVVVVLVSF